MASEQDSNKNDPKPDDGPKYMSAEEVTAMVTGANERMKKTLTAEIEKSLKTFTEQLPDLLKPQLEALKTELPKPDDKPPENKPDPKILALEQKLADTLKAVDAAEKARVAAEEKSRNESAKSALRSALAAHVRPEALDTVTKILFDADKRVTFGEDGSPLLKVRKAPVAGMPEEDMELPLTDGVSSWLKSDDAKLFLPAPGGTGDPKRGTPPARSSALGKDGMPQYDAPATTDDERVRRADERAAALAAKYPNFRDQI